MPKLPRVTGRELVRALEKAGLVEVRVSSDPATLSETIQFDVKPGEPISVTVVAPVPSETIQPTQIAPIPEEQDNFITVSGFPRLNTWMLTMIIITLGSALAYWVGSLLQPRPWGWRWGLCVLLGGLIGYNYLALGLPGSTQLALANGLEGVLGFVLLGEILGLGVAWLWYRLS